MLRLYLLRAQQLIHSHNMKLELIKETDKFSTPIVKIKMNSNNSITKANIIRIILDLG